MPTGRCIGVFILGASDQMIRIANYKDLSIDTDAGLMLAYLTCYRRNWQVRGPLMEYRRNVTQEIGRARRYLMPPFVKPCNSNAPVECPKMSVDKDC